MIFLVTIFYIYSFWFEIFPARTDVSPGFNSGCSVIWFIEVYLIGRYLRLFGVPTFINKYPFFLYTTCTISMCLVEYLYLYYYGRLNGILYSQNSPLVIMGAIAFFITFTKFRLRSKIVNRIATSTLAVLLLHNPTITKPLFKYISVNFQFVSGSIIWLFSVVVIFGACVLLDQIRIVTYKKIYPTMETLTNRIVNSFK